MFKNALVSVHNKTGLINFIKPLADKGMRITATGGTARFLKQAGVHVNSVEQQTGQQEQLSGRVKSLHPKIYIPLLAQKKDRPLLEQENLPAFDLLVCNLYPFPQTPQVENIDVGGPSMLRAGAKNFQHVTVVCRPSDYEAVLKSALNNKGPNLKQRRELAGKTFELLASYNLLIAKWLNTPQKTKDVYLKGRFFKTLRYGENPGQKASWFIHQTKGLQTEGLQSAVKLQGKDLSFNNLKDLDASVRMVSCFQKPCCAAVKHNNPCGVSINTHLNKAAGCALKADPLSVFGAAVALNKQVDAPTARTLTKIFLSAVIAPAYSQTALSILKTKKNLQVLKWPGLNTRPKQAPLVHTITGGFLMQEAIKTLPSTWPKSWRIIGDKPSKSVKADLLLAWKVCAHLKSNAIALVSQGQTVGLGMGQVSRIDSVKNSIARWKAFHPSVQNPVMASDGFFPFPDSVELAGQAGVKWIIQPGGSIRDQQALKAAEKLTVNMILTGQRCFLH